MYLPARLLLVSILSVLVSTEKISPLVPDALSLIPENIKKHCGFLMFPEGRERVHWEQMG